MQGAAGKSVRKPLAAGGKRVPSKARGHEAAAIPADRMTSRLLRPGVTVESLAACLSAEQRNWSLVQSALKLLEVPIAAGLGECKGGDSAVTVDCAWLAFIIRHCVLPFRAACRF